jgi:hypothetical protein
VRRVLLTGAAGRIATAVRPVLRELAAEVVLTDREEPAALESDERYVPADLADPMPWEALAARCDAIVHLGAVPDDGIPFQGGLTTAREYGGASDVGRDYRRQRRTPRARRRRLTLTRPTGARSQPRSVSMLHLTFVRVSCAASWL